LVTDYSGPANVAGYRSAHHLLYLPRLSILHGT